MNEPLKGNDAAAADIKALKHDIRNQLSNIQISIDQLRYEISEATDDTTFYIDTIVESCKKIEALLKER